MKEQLLLRKEEHHMMDFYKPDSEFESTAHRQLKFHMQKDCSSTREPNEGCTPSCCRGEILGASSVHLAR
jgi:hypothetical protein